MKKIAGFISILTSVALFTGCNRISSSSSNFEGIVTYEVKAGAGTPPEVTTMLQSMQMKTFVKGTLTRSEEAVAGNKNIVISDSKKPDDPIMLISMLGHNYAVKRNDSLKKIAEGTIPKIIYIDSASATKTIAGYVCKKAKVTMVIPHSDSVATEVYYTTDLPYADPEGQFKGLKGMPMEFSLNMGGLVIVIVAKTVEKKSLSDSLFTIPSGYKEMDITQLQKDMAKNIGADSAAGAQ